MNWCNWPKNFLESAKSAVALGMRERDMRPLEWLDYLTDQRERVESEVAMLLRNFCSNLQEAVRYNTPTIDVGRYTSCTNTPEMSELLSAYFAKLNLHLQIEKRQGVMLYSIDTDSAVAQLQTLTQEPDSTALRNIGLRIIGKGAADSVKDRPLYAAWSKFSATAGFQAWVDKHRLTADQIEAVRFGFQGVCP